MGILKVLKDLFTTEEPRVQSWEDPKSPPSQSLQGLSVEVNPTPSASYERQLGRLLNLYRVRNKTNAVTLEIERYKDSIEGLGYTAPNNADETLIQIELMKG